LELTTFKNVYSDVTTEQTHTGHSKCVHKPAFDESHDSQAANAHLVDSSEENDYHTIITHNHHSFHHLTKGRSLSRPK